MHRVCGVLYRLIEDLQEAGANVQGIALFMRAWQHCNTADTELERLSQLFASCEGRGGATLAQVWPLQSQTIRMLALGRAWSLRKQGLSFIYARASCRFSSMRLFVRAH